MQCKRINRGKTPLFFFCSFLIGWNTVPKNLIMPHGILIDTAAIAGIALYSANCSVPDFLNNSHMVGFSVVIY